jgi:ZIP family zinc transporter
MTAVVFALATFVSTALGGLFALHQRRRLHLVMGFAAGVMIAAALIDLLPGAFALCGAASIPRVLAASGLGFFCFFGIDRLVHEGAAGHGHRAKNVFGGAAALGLTMHSLFDGLAIGSAFRSSATLGLVVGVAVVAHDFGDGVSTVGVVLASRQAVRASLAWLLADALAPVLGAGAAGAIRISPGVLGLLLGFFAGSFLFIGAAHLLPEAAQRGRRLTAGLAAACGSGLVFAVTRIAER